MPLLLNSSSVVTCPHGGQTTHTPTQTRVLVSGAPVLVQTDANVIAGCAFTLPGPKPSPCTAIQWTVSATRVFAGGQPVLLQSSVGLCKSPDQAPQGPPMINPVQARVQGM